jgi:DNA-binding transcriptional LysR family regulator
MPAGIDYRWDEVKVFLAVMRERTLAGAAARLGLDASTVSRRLAAFEEAIGSRLFDRTRDGLLPRVNAERLQAAAEDLEAAALRLSRAAAERESAPEGVVRLTAVPGFAETFVVPYLCELHARYPGLRLDLDVSFAVADLTRREADLAMRISPPVGGDLVATKLLDLPNAVLAAPAYAATLGALADPAAARWIAWSREPAQAPAARWLARAAPDVEPVLCCESLTVQLGAVEAGLGVAVLPLAYAALRGLVVVPLGGLLAAAAAELPTYDLWLVSHRALREVPRIAAVWGFFLEVARRASAPRLP